MTYTKLNVQIIQPNESINWRPGGSRVPNTEEFPICYYYYYVEPH